MVSIMKKFFIISLIAVIAFSIAACDEKIDDGKIENASLEGTWVSSDGNKMVLGTDGSITMTMPIENVNVNARGTYSTSGNNITINITEVSSLMFAMMGLSPFQWYTLEQVNDVLVENFDVLVENFMEMSALLGEPITKSEAEEMLNELIDGLLEDVEFGEATGTYSITGNKMTLTMYGATTTFTKY